MINRIVLHCSRKYCNTNILLYPYTTPHYIVTSKAPTLALHCLYLQLLFKLSHEYNHMLLLYKMVHMGVDKMKLKIRINLCVSISKHGMK